MPDLTDIFIKLLDDPYSFIQESEMMARLDRLLISSYSKSCSSATLDDARLQLFSTGTKTLDALPPTSAAFYKHVRRAVLQASFFCIRVCYQCRVFLIIVAEDGSMRSQQKNGLSSGPHYKMQVRPVNSLKIVVVKLSAVGIASD